MSDGILDISYANGSWVVSGSDAHHASIFSVAVPDPNSATISINFKVDPPFGFEDPGTGHFASGASSYNNDTGIFTVPYDGANATIQNTLPSAIKPDPKWPIKGPFNLESVIGQGTRGLVEVRVNSIGLLSLGQYVATNFLEARLFGSSNWQSVLQVRYPIPFEQALAPGVIFRGLNFGTTKFDAVQFVPGGQ